MKKKSNSVLRYEDQARFTPGPWHVGDGKAATVIYAPDNYPVANATVYHWHHAGQAEQNARLIAAAPALLDICKMILASHQTGGVATIGEAVLCPHLEGALLAAIREAEGE
jgi:hypothetical protein